jgi:hypothetical protein
MITDHLFGNINNSVVGVVPGSLISQNQYRETRSPTTTKSFMSEYEYNRAHINDDPESFSRDMRFILNALS